MEQPPRPIAQQVGIIVAMLLTAVVAGIAIGWLLSWDRPRQVAQTRNPTLLLSPTPTLPSITATAPLPTATLAAPSPTIAPTLRPTDRPTERPTATTAPTLAPTPRPTIAPTPRPVATTAPPTSIPTPTATQEPATALLQQVAAAEAALRSGELEAVLDYGKGMRSSARVLFDLGTADQPARLDMKTTYQGEASAQTIEAITIGNRSWERRDNQSWRTIPARKGIWDQIRLFLPQAESGSHPRQIGQADRIELRWYDAAANADVTLVVDSETKVPRSLQRQPRQIGAILSVTYKRWNTPVEILPPVESP